MIKKTLKIGRFKLWELQRDYLRETHPLEYLFWECTLNCNFLCRHCGSRAGGCSNKTDELTATEIKNTFSKIAADFDAKNIMIAITGGEPLLRRDLFEVMAFAHEIGFNWGMVTNGYLIDEEKIKLMAQAGMSTIDISIDGLNEKHDDLRGVPGSYEKAVAAVKALTKANFLSVIRISTTVNKTNFHQLEEMKKLVFSWGAHAWRLIEIDPIGRAQDNKELLLNKEQSLDLLNFIKKSRKELGAEKITWPCTSFLGYEFEDEVRSSLFFCRTGITSCSILYNGDIYPCPNVERRPELIQGNVKNDDFVQTWNNKFKFFRNKERTQCSECKSCDYWQECLGGSLHLWDFEKKFPKKCLFRDWK
jgi:radical SAM protein with 4Fe4S-binding SPASM domain